MGLDIQRDSEREVEVPAPDETKLVPEGEPEKESQPEPQKVPAG